VDECMSDICIIRLCEELV